MANRNKFTKDILIFGMILLLCNTLFQVIFHECYLWTCLNKRPNEIWVQMNIPEDFFDDSTDYHSLAADRNSGSRDEFITTMYWEDGIAIYIVESYYSYKSAKEHYAWRVERFGNLEMLESNSPLYVDFQTPIKHELQYASQYEITCGKTGVIKSDSAEQIRCKFFGRYDEILVFFNADIDQTYMTAERFLKILIFLDENTYTVLESQ